MKTPTPTSEKKPRTTSKTKTAEVAAPPLSAPVKPAEAPEKAATPAVKPTTPSKSSANPQPAVAKKPASATAKAKKPQKPAEPLAESSPVPSAAAGDQPTASTQALPSQESINRMVEEAAYYLAEQRNFAPGFEEEDWLTAKQQIMAQLAKADNPVK